MARPVIDEVDESEVDDRSEVYSENANLSLNNPQQDVPIAGKGPTMVGMLGKSFGAIMNFVDLIMDAVLVAHFLNKTDCVHTTVGSSSNNSTDIQRDIQTIDLSYKTYGFVALRRVVKAFGNCAVTINNNL